MEGVIDPVKMKRPGKGFGRAAWVSVVVPVSVFVGLAVSLFLLEKVRWGDRVWVEGVFGDELIGGLILVVGSFVTGLVSCFELVRSQARYGWWVGLLGVLLSGTGVFLMLMAIVEWRVRDG